MENNRDLVTNSFEGGLDLDSDKRVVANNKLVLSENIDITKRGDALVVTDIKGETILFNFEDHSNKSVFILSSVTARFLVEPTGLSRQSVVVFYITSDLKFKVKVLYFDDFSIGAILEENLLQSEYDFLLNSTVDVEKVGKFGYDVLYFVDNRREPRKIDCVTYVTNQNEMTLTLNAQVENTGYKTILLNLQSSIAPIDPHRVYIYAYKTGGSLVYNPVNPSTEVIKYVLVSDEITSVVAFNIYPEDYGSYTFQIVYHKEGSKLYRNFIIGNPFQVVIEVGSTSTFLIGIRSEFDQPAVTQIPSWEFLYSGNSFVVYIDTPTIELGTTKAYLSAIIAPESLVPDGYYQRADAPNTYFRVNLGIIAEQTINNGVVSWSCLPAEIEIDVRAAATTITEGTVNRLDNVIIDVPVEVMSGGIEYYFVKNVGNEQLGRIKEAFSTYFSYTLEFPSDLSPYSIYAPNITQLNGYIFGVARFSNGYNVTIGAFATNALTQSMSVVVKVQVRDTRTGNLISPILATVVIAQGANQGQVVVYHEDTDVGAPAGERYVGDIQYGPACVNSYTYTGLEQIIVSNPC